MEFKVKQREKIKVQDLSGTIEINKPTMAQVEQYEIMAQSKDSGPKTTAAREFLESLSAPEDKDRWKLILTSWEIDTTLDFIEFILGRKKS